MYDLCKAVDVDYESVRQAVTEDSRIGDSHSWVTEQRGFGGHCFPKDTTAITKTGQRENVSLSLIKEAIEYNKRIRKD
jgi:UDPglucose 6-dehydrogenase